MNVFSSPDYKTLPWKNGKGFTRELYRLGDTDQEGEFLFRLSQASITQDGPFSLFPGIDRVLILLNGKGVKLQAYASLTLLSSLFLPFTFMGEESIQCELINGPCEDFNIMSRRGWKKIEVEVIHLVPLQKIITSLTEEFFYIAQGLIRANHQEVGQDGLIHLKNECVELEALNDTILIKIKLLD